jgi:hypothetical protein
MLCIAVTMVVCLGLWAATEYFMDARYTSSLHKNITMQLDARVKCSAPMVMKSKVDPLEFEKVPIVFHDIQHELDTKASSTPFLSTLEQSNDK